MLLVSVIIPAFKAQATIGRAVASIQKAGIPMHQIQIIIAPDDRQDYGFLSCQTKSLTFVQSDAIGSGAGPSRNRALLAATGDYVAFLDADDTWEPGYLADLLPLAQQAGAAFGRTSILLQNREILRLPLSGAETMLSFEHMARSGASFHPLVQRKNAGPFANRASQDILQSLEVLALYGGTVPMAKAAYQLRISPASVTASADFSRRAAVAYTEYQSDIKRGVTRIPDAFHADAISVFATKKQLNQAYMDAGQDQSYYQFIAAQTWTTASNEQGCI